MSAEVKTRGAFIGAVGTAIAITVAFFALAKALGRYSDLDIYMASVYVFIISMIVTASLIPPLFKRIQRGK